MGLFSSSSGWSANADRHARSAKVPDTIGDKKWRDLQRRGRKTEEAQKAFSKKAVAKRLASEKQRGKSWWS